MLPWYCEMNDEIFKGKTNWHKPCQKEKRASPSLLHSYITRLAPATSHLVLLVVKVLLGDTATEVLGLGAANVDILEQDLGGGVGSGHGFGLLDFGIDALACLLVDGLEFGLGGDFPVENLLLETGDGVLGAAHTLDFLASLLMGKC